MSRQRAPKGYYAQPEPPAICLHCNQEVDLDHWRQVNAPRTKSGKAWDCVVRRKGYAADHYARQMADPARREERRSADRDKYFQSRNYLRWAAYRAADKRAGRANDLPWEVAHSLMTSPCHYCGGQGDNGLDRLDSELGHTVANCLPCCPHCNYVFGDLPPVAKGLLADGLRACREAGVWAAWTPPLHRRSSPNTPTNP